MRLLLASGAKHKFVSNQQFTDALTKLGVECKLVKETDYAGGFPSKKVSEWVSKKKFNDLINEFKPDAVFADRQLHFASNTIDAKIPLFLFLRGHYWLELEWAKKTRYRDRMMSTVLWFRNRIADKCFRNATAILPLSKYLAGVVREHYPDRPIHVLVDGIDPSLWHHKEGMKLKHPCVGLLQDANWWGKTKEMLTLKNVLQEMPQVHFYWAGDGPYREQVISVIGKYDNFHWLGRLQYPDKVKEYLSEIDVYALFTGLETLGITILEASLIRKPIIATNGSAIPEFIQDGKTGYLVNEGDYKGWIDKISLLLNDSLVANRLAQSGYEFVRDNFSWKKMATDFLSIAKMYVKE